MKEQILEKIFAVQRALGNITVSGETNCLNLGGAMQVLREISQELYNSEIQKTDTEKEVKA